MSIIEVGALAQLVGAIAILLSLVFIVIELRKNFKQNNIANSTVRSIELEKLNYARMDENLAKVLVKAFQSYEGLKGFEKIQFEGYVLQQFAVSQRAYWTADETAFKLGAENLRDRVKVSMSIFFSHPRVRECYQALRDQDAIHSHELLLTIIGEDVLARPAG